MTSRSGWNAGTMLATLISDSADAEVDALVVEDDDPERAEHFRANAAVLNNAAGIIRRALDRGASDQEIRAALTRGGHTALGKAQS